MQRHCTCASVMQNSSRGDENKCEVCSLSIDMYNWKMSLPFLLFVCLWQFIFLALAPRSPAIQWTKTVRGWTKCALRWRLCVLFFLYQWRKVVTWVDSSHIYFFSSLSFLFISSFSFHPPPPFQSSFILASKFFVFLLLMMRNTKAAVAVT